MCIRDRHLLTSRLRGFLVRRRREKGTLFIINRVRQSLVKQSTPKRTKAFETVKNCRCNDGWIYSGTLMNGERKGKGIGILDNGSSYEGMWDCNYFSGEGSYKLSNGEVIEGHWEEGKLSGKGKHTFSSGEIIEGDFVNDLPNGNVIQIKPGIWRYEGQFRNGKMHGKGTLTFHCGKSYTGDFDNDEMHGFGELQENEGAVYICLLYTSPSPRDLSTSRMPSSA
eukprot:TRINITY_DN12150_c0_g1_i3.p1 TRINITY_DN12150_c0_g1~~TRINITY_DN12150_c0_g1_i3.p1  ORF type:complete len:224 (+),score=25.92 TRINITY_DN12150_c0_g1_i3:167-838(+)